MKRTFFCLLAALTLASSCAAAARAAGTEITASGTGSVSLPPDIANVDAAVETNFASADEAVSQNNRIYDRIVAALTKLGIAREDLTFSSYNVNYNPRPQIVPPNSSERYGYTVSRAFRVKVREMARAGAAVDACTAAGATGINGVSFGRSDQNAARAEAIGKAVADARNNAEALARGAALHIISIKSIELLNGGYAGPAVMRMSAPAPTPTNFDQTTVEVAASVTVVFIAGP
jgi:hypothetical protein